MKKLILVSVIVFLVGLIAFYLYFNMPEPTVRLIRIKGPSGCYNFTKNYSSFSLGISVDSITATPAEENDLISIESEEFFYQVRKEDGEYLNFRNDSMKTYLNDKLISIIIDRSNGSYDWLRTCTREEVKNLRSIFITDSIPDNCMPGIKRIAESTSNLGLYIQKSLKNRSELVVLFNPIWIFPEEIGQDTDFINAIFKSSHLEMLYISANELDMSRLSKLPKLKSLMVNDLDSSSIYKFEQLPENISSLEIFESDIVNLNFLEGCTKIRELNITSSRLQNIQALSNLPDLEVLSLINCDSIADLRPLSKLHHLKWITPPWNIDEIDLENIVKNSPNIETLVLNGCKHLKSLAPLKQLTRLTNLSIISTPIEADSLVQFQKLKYLSFHTGLETDSLNLIKLKSMMSGTLVIPAEPFCMGSGWLLEFFLLLIGGCLTFIGYKRRYLK